MARQHATSVVPIPPNATGWDKSDALAPAPAKVGCGPCKILMFP